MRRMERDLGVLFVAAAGNSNGAAVNSYPQLAHKYLQGMINVGSTDIQGRRAAHSSTGPIVDVGAPGELLLVPQPNILVGEQLWKQGYGRGTSFGAFPPSPVPYIDFTLL